MGQQVKPAEIDFSSLVTHCYIKSKQEREIRAPQKQKYWKFGTKVENIFVLTNLKLLDANSWLPNE